MAIFMDKKTKRFFIQFDYLGKTFKKRMPEGMTKRDAEKIEARFKRDLFFEVNGVEKKQDIYFEDFLVDYFLPFAVNHYSADGYKHVELICRASLKFLKGRLLRKVRAADIEQFKNYRAALETINGGKRKPATVVRELGIISKVFSYAVKNEFLDFNPCSRVDRPVYDNIQDTILPPAMMARFLNAFKSTWARDLTVLILNTGLRQNDALGLKKFQVDFNARMIRTIQGKTKRRVDIPMNETVFNLLNARRRNGSELFFPSPKTGKQGTSIKKALEGACARANIGKFGTRVLRRTFGTRLEEMNFNDSTVAKLLGHSDLRSIHRYRRGKDILRDAVEALDSANPAKILPTAEIKAFKKAGNG